MSCPFLNDSFASDCSRLAHSVCTLIPRQNAVGICFPCSLIIETLIERKPQHRALHFRLHVVKAYRVRMLLVLVQPGSAYNTPSPCQTHVVRLSSSPACSTACYWSFRGLDPRIARESAHMVSQTLGRDGSSTTPSQSGQMLLVCLAPRRARV